MNVDTTEHYMFFCEKVKLFWKSVQKWLANITQVDIEFALLEIIFGILVKGFHTYITNYVIPKGKLYIYECNKK